MDSNRISTPVERDANVDRLRSMTSTAVVAGAAAVLTFGVAAWISNPGRTTTATTSGTTSVQSGTSGSTNGNASTQGGTSSAQNGTSNSSGSTSQSNGFFQAPAQQPQFFGGGGQSTTGGS